MAAEQVSNVHGGPETRSTTGARIVFDAGAPHVVLRADDTLPDQYRARFERPVPAVSRNGNRITMHYSGFPLLDWILFKSRRVAELTLNGSVPWWLEFRKGLWKLDGDLTDLRLDGIEISGGVSRIELTLPRPSGTVPIEISGGASKVVLHRPAGIPAQVEVKGGASSLDIDNQHFGGIGQTTRWNTAGYREAYDRYRIYISGGASHVIVDAC
jgi:hypothetical protein